MRFSLLAVTVVVALALGACSSDATADPADVETCDALAHLAADRIRAVVDDIGSSSISDLRKEAGDSEDPFADLRDPFDGFEERSGQLGCIEEDLVLQTCAALKGLQARGDAAEEYLRGYFETCD